MNIKQYKKYNIENKSGVYLYYNKENQVIYVGKAKNLKKRTSQYFQNKKHDLKTKSLIKDVVKIETIITDSELDALFLESELIKRYKPQYNILLRDDKSTTYLKILNQKLPVISFTRNPIDDNAEYYGPFYNIYPIKQAMRYLRWIFPYLTPNYKNKNRSNLNMQIGLEPKLENQRQINKYLADIKQIKLYIKGELEQIIKNLENQMNKAAKKQNFEQAAKIRNQIFQLNSLKNKVRINQINNSLNDKSLIEIAKLFGLEKEPKRIEGYDVSHMSGTNVVSSMVVFTNGLSDRSEYRRFKIKIDQNNDFYNMRETMIRRSNKEWVKPDLILIDGGKGQLNMAIDGLKNTKFANIPIFGLAKKQELLVISKEKSNIKIDQNFIDNKKGVFVEEDNFYLVDLNNSDSIIKLVQRIRDEAHRFAIGYHTKLKRQTQTVSYLDNIKGIGPKTKQKLLKKYKTLNMISRTPEKDLEKLIGKQKTKIISKILKK